MWSLGGDAIAVATTALVASLYIASDVTSSVVTFSFYFIYATQVPLVFVYVSSHKKFHYTFVQFFISSKEQTGRPKFDRQLQVKNYYYA